MRQSGQAVDGDDWDASPVFVAVARQLRISAQIIFFQSKEGVGLGRGRGLVVIGLSLTFRRKNGILILGRL